MLKHQTDINNINLDHNGDTLPNQSYQGFSVIQMNNMSTANESDETTEQAHLERLQSTISSQPEASPKSSLSVSSILSGICKGFTARQPHDNKHAVKQGLTEIPSPVSVQRPSSEQHVESDHQTSDENFIFKSPRTDESDVQEYRQLVEENRKGSFHFPVICLVDYAVGGSYAVDLWVLFHNTIRRELFDFFEIMTSIRKIGFSMTSTDMVKLREWWRFFVALWSQFAAHEKLSLDPIIRHICQVDGRGESLQRQIRPLRENEEWLALKLEEVTSYLEEFERLPPGRALFLFNQTADAFANRLMVQFAEQEKMLPPLVENYFGEHIKSSIERQLVSRLRGSAQFGLFVVAVLRWMGSVEGFASAQAQCRDKDKWMALHLTWLERVKLSSYKQKYESSHASLVAYFRNRAASALPVT